MGLCSQVCVRGSVHIDPWYTRAATWQRAVSEQLPFCWSTILGSHNSAITLADGYGNEDAYWQTFFAYIPEAVCPSPTAGASALCWVNSERDWVPVLLCKL